MTWVLIAGGGTAGHVLPGLAVARELVDRGCDASQIHFVGSQRGMEAGLFAAGGFDATLLPGRGIQRRLSLQNLSSMWGLVKAFGMAAALLRRRRPAVVLSLGGFASAACSFAALIWRVPLVIADQNAKAGAANRLFGRFASACAVPFSDTDLPNSVVTGNPVRDEILAVANSSDRAATRDAARRELGLPADRTVIAAFAGSLGSRRLNQAVYGAVEAWAHRDDLAIHHVVGERDWAERPSLDIGEVHYQSVQYESRMDLVLAASDLAVCRSGGTTVAELTVVGLPSILVPLPIATRDHQSANAAELVSAGGAVIVADRDFDSTRLVSEVESLIGSCEGGSRLQSMATSAASLGRPDAASRVADLLFEYATVPPGDCSSERP